MRPRASSAETSPRGREKQRSRTGCKTCRSRKVKCDERPGGCYNCSRLNLPCPNSAAYHDAIQNGEIEGDYLRTQAGLRRSRTYRSCRSCRSSKSRCSGERPTCLRCRQRGFHCRYDGKQAPAWLEAASSEADARSPGKGGRSSSDGPVNSHPSSPALSHTDANSSRCFQEPTPEPAICAPFSWLLAPELPRSHERILNLVEAFFVNVHSLRSFGFIHRPSVLSYLEQWSCSWYEHQEDSLLLAVCALGAKYCAIEYDGGLQVPDGLALAAGSQWARKAQQLVVSDSNSSSMKNTMAIVLLHEHELQVGNYTNAFVLTGLGVRMAQALSLNVEDSFGDIRSSTGTKSITTRESKRRLMWSIYIMDSWVGSGVDELTLLEEADIQIQLPCSDTSFIAQQPRIVEALQPGTYSSFVDSGEGSQELMEPLDLQGEFIRLVSLRRRVLRFVKHLDRTQPPWLPGSEFLQLQGQLKLWMNKLPNTLRFSQSAVYERKKTHQLGGLLFCHVTFHQTVCDLMRIAMQAPFGTPDCVDGLAEPAAFIQCAQDQLFEHCMATCALFEEAMRHGHSALADTWLSVVAHDSAEVIIQYISQGMGSSGTKGEAFKANAMSAVHSNIRALHTMIPLHYIAQSLHSAVIRMLLKAGLPVPQPMNAEHPSPIVILENEDTSTVDQQSLNQYPPEHVLNPLAIFRLARKDMREWKKQPPDFGSYTGSDSPEERPTTPADDQGIFGLAPPHTGSVPELGISTTTSSPFSQYPVTSPISATTFVDDGMAPPAYGNPANNYPSTSVLDKALTYYNLAGHQPEVSMAMCGMNSPDPAGFTGVVPPFMPVYTNTSMYPPSTSSQVVADDFFGLPVSCSDSLPNAPPMHLMNWAI